MFFEVASVSNPSLSFIYALTTVNVDRDIVIAMIKISMILLQLNNIIMAIVLL